MIPPKVMQNTEIVEMQAEQTTLTRRYTEEAVQFIEQSKEALSSFTCRIRSRISRFTHHRSSVASLPWDSMETSSKSSIGASAKS